MYGPNLGWVFWEWTVARGFWEARGWPSRAKRMSVSLPILALNYWIKGERKSKSHPAPGPHLTQLAISPCLFIHSNWNAHGAQLLGTLQVSCWLCYKEASKFIALSLPERRWSELPISPYLFFPHTPLHVAYSSAAPTWICADETCQCRFHPTSTCIISLSLAYEEMHFLSCYLLNTKAYSISSERLMPAEKLLRWQLEYEYDWHYLTGLCEMHTSCEKKASFLFSLGTL